VAAQVLHQSVIRCVLFVFSRGHHCNVGQTAHF